jgi:superoxide dismutase, Cu-Zn family
MRYRVLSAVMFVLAAFAAAVSVAVSTAEAATVTVTVNKIDENGVGAAAGSLTLEDTGAGLRITPSLTGLPPGPHGFHVHANASCAAAEQDGRKVAGLAAGGHFDPAKSGKHLGPASSEGHKGDMPVLTVAADGSAKAAVIVPHLTVADALGHAIVIHAGGDNYADTPAPLGGGGARIACGVVK